MCVSASYSTIVKKERKKFWYVRTRKMTTVSVPYSQKGCYNLTDVLYRSYIETGSTLPTKDLCLLCLCVQVNFTIAKGCTFLPGSLFYFIFVDVRWVVHTGIIALNNRIKCVVYLSTSKLQSHKSNWLMSYFCYLIFIAFPGFFIAMM